MAKAVCFILAAALLLICADGCRRVRAPYKPKGPPQPRTEEIVDATSRPATSRPASGPVYVTYVVKSHDTLGKIAKNVSGNEANWQLILDANPGLDERNLKTGMEIRVPVKRNRLAQTAAATSPAQ